MKHQLRFILCKYILHKGIVAHISDNTMQMIRLCCLDRLLDIIESRLCLIHQDQFFIMASCDLTGQFRTNGACGTGNKNHFALHLLFNLRMIQFNRLTTKQILNF
ncbi:hypothetical protein D3C73_1482910 [compost metagenome]